MVNVGFRHTHKMRGLASVSQESPIRVGLIGFGFVSKTFHIPLLQATDGYRITAVSSSRPADVSAVLPDVESGQLVRRVNCSGRISTNPREH
jgi:predicted homoserine dehydrogenase-like protein